MLPTLPPPAERTPGVRKAGHEPLRFEIRDVVWAFSREFQMGYRDWVEIVGEDIGQVQRVLNCRRPWPREWEARLPLRHRRILAARIDEVIESYCARRSA